jgi:hypothetical protein
MRACQSGLARSIATGPARRNLPVLLMNGFADGGPQGRPITQSIASVLPRVTDSTADRDVQSMRISGGGNSDADPCRWSRLHQTNTTMSTFVSVQFRSNTCGLGGVGQRHGRATTRAQQHRSSIRINVHVAWIHRRREDGIGDCAYSVAERRCVQPCSSGIS